MPIVPNRSVHSPLVIPGWRYLLLIQHVERSYGIYSPYFFFRWFTYQTVVFQYIAHLVRWFIKLWLFSSKFFNFSIYDIPMFHGYQYWNPRSIPRWKSWAKAHAQHSRLHEAASSHSPPWIQGWPRPAVLTTTWISWDVWWNFRWKRRKDFALKGVIFQL